MSSDHPTCEPLESRVFLATHGLSATYFDALEFGGHSVKRTDSRIDFDWGNHRRPATGIKGNTYTVRWDGLLQSRAAGTYTFSVRNNDGVRVWVNGDLLVDSWKSSPRRTLSGSITLKAKTLYDLRVEYFDQDRTAAIQLRWSGPGFATEVVPGARMYAYDTRFAAIGDYGRTNAYAQGTAHIATSFSPDFIITVGDNNYDSGSADTIDENVGQYYHWYIGNYQGNFGGGPRKNHFFPSIGNHDWVPPQGSIAPYKDYFTLPGNERYYDYEQGDIHFFVLDSDPHEPDGRTSDSKQASWLKSALAGSTSPYNVVYFHHAPYSSGEHGDSSWMQWPFKDWGADVVLSGHDHQYERLIEGGLTYVVDGAGSGPSTLGKLRTGSVAHNDTDSGALLIQANSLAMTFEYQLRSGAIVDAFTIPASA